MNYAFEIFPTLCNLMLPQKSLTAVLNACHICHISWPNMADCHAVMSSRASLKHLKSCKRLWLTKTSVVKGGAVAFIAMIGISTMPQEEFLTPD